jgi:alcohol dehydrogenase (cytochrome c)
MKGSLLFSCIGACVLGLSVTVLGQARLDPGKLLTAPTDSWPTFNGDYSGRRFSPLTRITSANVHQLSLAWMFRITGTGLGAIKSTPLQINGILYFTVPDHVWAVDARSGRELWHYQWQTTGGNHLGNRGVAVHEDSLYFETPDCFLISLNLKDGKERWRRQICDIDKFITRRWHRPP